MFGSIPAVGLGVTSCGSGQGVDTSNKPLKGLFSKAASDNNFQHVVIIFHYQFPLTKSASLPASGARKEPR